MKSLQMRFTFSPFLCFAGLMVEKARIEVCLSIASTDGLDLGERTSWCAVSFTSIRYRGLNALDLEGSILLGLIDGHIRG